MRRVIMEGSVLTNVTASEMNFLGKRINFVNIAYASPQLITLRVKQSKTAYSNA
jgi:hypothetical protein